MKKDTAKENSDRESGLMSGATIPIALYLASVNVIGRRAQKYANSARRILDFRNLPHPHIYRQRSPWL
ncbi:hypothetical protein IQ235_15885 [Oscillatoriales cyanobacterium LEGE 11467]|uniref:Uncharacterized protein n=1 Tax=Zarconia navalis LEGE 11467 TaxID=1828826 RepID=A0A928VXT4_9CYAN|nr:hypothetical protein [Zarconia navalis]MBE9042259.1 hypothetical protein [Zarconia navalis LEGE 11467]